MKRAVIISAGSIKDYEYTKAFIREGDFVICADGGLLHAEKMGIVPSLTVGDFDSYKGEVTGEVKKFNPEKDYTDTDLAVKEALERGCEEIIMLGATGTRLDHTLSNIGLLEYLLDKGIKGTIVNETNIISVIQKSAAIKKKEGWHVSFIPIGRVKGVTIKNLKYTLDNYDLKFSESLAVSNEFEENDGLVEIKEGSLIVILSRD